MQDDRTSGTHQRNSRSEGPSASCACRTVGHQSLMPEEIPLIRLSYDPVQGNAQSNSKGLTGKPVSLRGIAIENTLPFAAGRAACRAKGVGESTTSSSRAWRPSASFPASASPWSRRPGWFRVHPRQSSRRREPGSFPPSARLPCLSLR